MTDSAAQTQKLLDLVDRSDIRDCLLRCARGVDRLDRDLILSAYHDDAIDDHGKFVGGPVEFADWVIDMHGRTHLTHQHCLLNHTCELVGDVAHSETYYLFVGINRTGQPMAVSGGRYIDRLERRDDRWAIAFRLCLRDWSPVEEQPDMADASAFTNTRTSLPPEIRSFMQTGAVPRRDRLDPSYARPLEADPMRLAAWLALDK